MTNLPEGNTTRVVKFVQELLLDEKRGSPITPALIAEKINLVVGIKPTWGEGLDHAAVTDELIRRFSLWVGDNTTLKSDVGHERWLSAARKREWRYWQRYREWLEKQLSWKAVEALDVATDTILAQLEDPVRIGPWDRRGLVVGHVQSGKTGNYTGLICKGADAGYKIIIVLAGLHNNLRSQTQIRLDEGFLGYETTPVPDDIKITGVGQIDSDPTIRPNYATNRSENGDFNTAAATHLGISPEQRPWLFVVKKNKTVLERLYRWIRNHVANTQDTETGHRTVTHLPLLLIDDEADHASVDTGEQVFRPDGTADEEHEPTAINSRIRKILHSFSRAAYVGYTATPFANIFIHERGETIEEGPDLFPAAFISNLGAPSDYIGPARVFGLNAEGEDQGGLPLVRELVDHGSDDEPVGWMPQKHKNGHVPRYAGDDALPPSLVEAIDAFLLTCVVRRLRGQGRQHSSMLVHVTRFNSVQQAVHRQVQSQVLHLRQRLLRQIDHDQILERLETLWVRDFLPTNAETRRRLPSLDLPELPHWDDVARVLADAVADIEVRMINGTAKDALDYSEHTNTGLKVIAIGGDKLARGLTLEGLSVSYFLRASKMYDTLMQMGRWFGYRPGYLDLCRLYTTGELCDWFRHITLAAEELRGEFDLMAETGATPRDYGLKVQSHPVLMVTSRLKMRSSRNLMLSFSGQLLETVALYKDTVVLGRNLDATRRLIAGIGPPKEKNTVLRVRSSVRQEWKGYLWEDVPAADIVDYLSTYRTHPEAYKVNSTMMSEFVESMTASGELTHWTVALIGGGEGGNTEIVNGVRVDMLKRESNRSSDDRYSIGRLMSPRDEAIDFDSVAWDAALALTRQSWHADPGRLRKTKEPESPNGPAIRRTRGFGADGVPAHLERGVLLVYALDPRPAWTGLPEGAPPVIAIGVSFPASTSGVKVQYKVNNILWDQQYGAAE